ncbi:uncharacterized protein Dwil_GK22057 [Drosophila willistoni]|uniref:Protein TsetseEP domain-containing protein n=1 Tax=Drosophila willistoni TaxID=7260 RepID=B4MYL3_DROWI|nr:uncharacterized protein LOC6643246 [Drosophila willistoni]EDW77202.1 uncharacterized protein Dwil_GK22057 [Drosophila willistoni]
MFVKSYSITLVTIILIGWSGADPSSMTGQSKLYELMWSTRDLQNSNPSRSLECFQYYSPIFDNHLKVYEAEYGACKNRSALEKEDLLARYIFVVDELNNSSRNACQALNTCSKGEDSLESLTCYDKTGSTNTNVMYNVSTTASIYRAQLEHQIQTITYNDDICTSAAQHKYDSNFNAAYIDLQNCLNGLAPVPNNNVTTTREGPATITTETTDAAPNATTIPPLTLKPDDGKSNSTAKSPNHGIISDIDNIINKIEHLV